MSRKIKVLSERDFVRNRLHIWLGTDMPHTISMKEVIDNEIDVINDREQSAKKVIIHLGPNRLKLQDDGSGIPTDIQEGNDKSDLFLACAKMYSSTNYDGVEDTVGSNGVGLTIANFTSKEFKIFNLNGRQVKGYQFTEGILNGSDESEITKDLEDGDYVENPMQRQEAIQKLKPHFENRGFLVDILWNETPNSVFQDTPDLKWLINYTKLRVGEITNGEVELHVFKDNDLTELKEKYVWNKDKENKETYVESWEERVISSNGVIVKDGPWRIAFATNDMEVESFVQYAPIKPRFKTTVGIQIQDFNVRLQVPVSIFYVSTEQPKYTDQTKVDITYPYTVVGKAFERSDKVYKHFYREAEKAYMAKVIKDSDSAMFWPALDGPENSELIIAEGFSAISGIKAKRNPRTQACIALRGKILNCRNLEMTKAMNSPVVKQILNAVLYSNYKQIIIAVDADADGNHIASLLISLFARFTNLLEDGKVKYVNTPHYLFKKRGSELKWSDEASDCPKGYHVTTLKGLGGMTSEEVKLFITNPDTRELIDIVWDGDDADEALDQAFSYGGEHWIV